MKCQVCDNTISDKWVYCPQCGTNLREIDKKEGYSVDKSFKSPTEPRDELRLDDWRSALCF